VGRPRDGRAVRGGLLIDAPVPDAALALYALPPDSFIAGRDALAKELKAVGEDDAAAAVKKLRKPSIVAWAVNAAAREHGDDVAALREAGQGLRRAQRKALSGGGGEDLRRATDERRALVGTLADAAVTAIGARGAAHRDAIAATLEAAAVDDELGERVATGTLEREAQPTAGFGTIEGFEVLTGGGAEPEEEPAEDRAAEQRERAREARAAAQRAATAERAAERAQRRASQLKEKAAAASAAAKEAESEARRLTDEARTERKRADRAARAAEAVGGSKR
jgi:hypothetical protein